MVVMFSPVGWLAGLHINRIAQDEENGLFGQFGLSGCIQSTDCLFRPSSVWEGTDIKTLIGKVNVIFLFSR